MEQCLCRLEPNRLNRIVRFLSGVDHIPVRYGLRLRTQGAGRLKSLGRRRRRLKSAGDRTVGVTLYGLESVLRTILLGQFLSIQPGCVANPTAPIRAAEYDCPHDWY